MNVQIVNNSDHKLAGVLKSSIEVASDIKIAVAFASQSGLSIIERELDTALQSSATIEFLLGLDMQTTEPDAVWRLQEMSKQHKNVALYCYASITRGAIYHPKMYLLRQKVDNGIETSATVVIGSSNLTAGGLQRNIEVNVVLAGLTLDEPISDAYATYDKLKHLEGRVEPDDEFLTLYEDLRKKQRERELTPTDSTRDLLTRFNEKAKSLRRPERTRADLYGWLELVYDAAPYGEFTNDQIYAQAARFSTYYPDNMNIEAKIRQKLQELRDMGFLEHVYRGRWRKV